MREKPLIESAHVAGFISPPRRVRSFDTHNDNKFPSSFITRLTAHGLLALLQLWGSSCWWLRRDPLAAPLFPCLCDADIKAARLKIEPSGRLARVLLPRRLSHQSNYDLIAQGGLV